MQLRVSHSHSPSCNKIDQVKSKTNHSKNQHSLLYWMLKEMGGNEWNWLLRNFQFEILNRGNAIKALEECLQGLFGFLRSPASLWIILLQWWKDGRRSSNAYLLKLTFNVRTRLKLAKDSARLVKHSLVPMRLSVAKCPIPSIFKARVSRSGTFVAALFTIPLANRAEIWAFSHPQLQECRIESVSYQPTNSNSRITPLF